MGGLGPLPDLSEAHTAGVLAGLRLTGAAGGVAEWAGWAMVC